MIKCITSWPIFQRREPVVGDGLHHPLLTIEIGTRRLKLRFAARNLLPDSRASGNEELVELAALAPMEWRLVQLDLGENFEPSLISKIIRMRIGRLIALVSFRVSVSSKQN